MCTCLLSSQYFNSGQNFDSTVAPRVGGILQSTDFCPFQNQILVCATQLHVTRIRFIGLFSIKSFKNYIFCVHAVWITTALFLKNFHDVVGTGHLLHIL